MRAINISLSIIICMLAFQIILETNASYSTEYCAQTLERYGECYNRTLWVSVDNGMSLPLTRDDPAFGLINRTNINGTIENVITPREQPTNIMTMDYITTATYLLRLVQFIFTVLFNSTLGFPSFIHTFGTSQEIVPMNIALTIGLLVNLCHAFAIYQLITKGDTRAGA